MKKFKRIYIEIINTCNLDCSFCPKTTRKSNYIEPKDFEKILQKIKGHTDYICLHIMGEPTLHPYFKEIIELASRYKIILTTNGTTIKKTKDIILNAKSIHLVNISLHSFEANKYGNFDNYLKNIIEFCREISSSGKLCSLRIWNFDSSINDIKGKNSLNEILFSKLEKSFNLDYLIGEKFEEKTNLTLIKNIFLERSEIFVWPEIEKDEVNTDLFCYGLRWQLGILADGTVVPCCLDHNGDIPLGNIFSENLEDIINSERAKNIYDGFSNRKAIEKLCKTCGYANKFK